MQINAQTISNMTEDEAAETDLLRPQYPGDDTRPTSKKELLGWYSYGWAAEVFTVCAMGKKLFAVLLSTSLP
jgi:UMF1 family MFS transporter